MDQPGKKGPPVSGGGFTVAALLAPGMALAIWFISVGLTAFSPDPGVIGRLIGAFLLLLLIVSFWGLLPSLLFGGLVLALIQRFWPGRPHRLVFVAGGGLAAGLYVLTGLATHHLSPGAAMFLAPWTTSPVGPDPAWWVWTSLILSGLGAGLIYSAFAKRG